MSTGNPEPGAPEGWPEFDAEKVKDAAEMALICAILGLDGETGKAYAERYSDAMGTIVEFGPRAVHVALSGWCGLTLHGFARTRGEPMHSADGYWGLVAENEMTGERVSVDKVGDPAVRDAMRIATCFGNKDHAIIAAIVATAWNDGADTLGNLMSEAVRLAAMTAQHLRRLREAGDGNGGLTHE